MQEAVANFQPTSQDLDYPGKLQRLAEQPESAAASAATEQTPLVGAAVANGDSSSLVSPTHLRHVAGFIGPYLVCLHTNAAYAEELACRDSSTYMYLCRAPGVVSWYTLLAVMVACTFTSCNKHLPGYTTPCEVVCLLQKESSPSAYASWYPPVQQTLLCLSKLYRCVEARVFAGLAQDAVSSCTKAVQVPLQSGIITPHCMSPCHARTWPLERKHDVRVCCSMRRGRQLLHRHNALSTKAKNPADWGLWGVQEAAKAVQKRSSAMDGQLFLIKQLLILREQIAPFEADFSVVEKDLDFTHMRDHLRRILAGMVPATLQARASFVELHVYI